MAVLELRARLQAVEKNPEDLAAANALVAAAMQAPEAADTLGRELQKELTLDGFVYHNLRMKKAPRHMEAPESRAALRKLLEGVGKSKEHTRAIGGGWGFSDAGATEGLLLKMEKLNAILPVQDGSVREDVGELCRFEAGATIDDLSEALWAKGRALKTRPGYGGLTYVGCGVAGGHGTGTRGGTLSEAFRSLEFYLVGANGKVRDVVIEPSKGIHDPAKFASHNPGRELLQDDDLFAAAKVSIGALGVIHAATIVTRPAFFLQEDRQKADWKVVRKNILQWAKDPGFYGITVWLSPYEVKGEQPCVVIRYTPVEGPAHGLRSLGTLLGGVPALGDLMRWLSNSHPEAVPAILSSVLGGMEQKGVVLRSYKALDFGPPNKLPVQAASAGVPLEDGVKAADAVCAALQKRAKEKKQYLTSPLGVRFVSADRAWLSPQHGRETCMFEAPLLIGTNGASETLLCFYDTLYDGFAARPHWGEVGPIDASRFPTEVPEYVKFKDAIQKLDPLGVFANPLTERLKLH